MCWILDVWWQGCSRSFCPRPLRRSVAPLRGCRGMFVSHEHRGTLNSELGSTNLYFPWLRGVCKNTSVLPWHRFGPFLLLHSEWWRPIEVINIGMTASSAGFLGDELSSTRYAPDTRSALPSRSVSPPATPQVLPFPTSGSPKSECSVCV